MLLESAPSVLTTRLAPPESLSNIEAVSAATCRRSQFIRVAASAQATQEPRPAQYRTTQDCIGEMARLHPRQGRLKESRPTQRFGGPSWNRHSPQGSARISITRHSPSGRASSLDHALQLRLQRGEAGDAPAPPAGGRGRWRRRRRRTGPARPAARGSPRSSKPSS